MPYADLVLKNVRALTLDRDQPEAELVAIKGDRILFAGGKDNLDSLSGAGTRVVDCAGKTLVPGFNDAHCHIFSFLRLLLSLDISPAAVSSIGDIKTVIHQRAQKTREGQWITASGYNDFYLAEKRHPTRWDIDEAAPDHPVILAHRSLHACVLNSRALSLAGISGETDEPPGATIERDLTSGEPNGLLFEMVGHITNDVMPRLSEAEVDEGIVLANQRFLSRGITSLQDATVTNDFKRWQQFRRLKEAGLLKSRLFVMFGAGAMEEIREAGLFAGFGNSHLSVGAIKIVLTDAPGQVYPPQSELNRQVLTAHQAGFQVAIHAVTQVTVEAAITALEYADSRLPVADRRHRIEHCSECPPPLLERLMRLDAAVVTQPPFLYYSGERYLAMVPPDRLPWLYRIKSFLDSGLVVAGSSDSPITPENPLTGICAAVTRNAETLRQAQGERVVVPEERITPIQALEMYTLSGAYASFEEGIKGSITQGKLADMVLLSDDPTQVAPEEIKDIRVEMTVLGGEVVWEG